MSLGTQQLTSSEAEPTCTCPICEAFHGPQASVEAHVSGKNDDLHQGLTGHDVRDDLGESPSEVKESPQQLDAEMDSGSGEEPRSTEVNSPEFETLADRLDEGDHQHDTNEATEESPSTGISKNAVYILLAFLIIVVLIAAASSNSTRSTREIRDESETREN